ncbi:MAG: hypothetical protein U9O83_02815 [Campylobacterota bacterium]|nr:hypothetical protein [Campylobacterota bacterium]
MLVLGIILAVIVAILVYMLTQKIDGYTYTKYEYEFFTTDKFLTFFVAYLLLYFGNDWHEQALKASEDPLNGIVLIFIGALLILVNIYNNINNTSFILGFSVSIFQLVLFGVCSFFAFFALIVAVAFFANTRPVYNIN